MRRESGAELIAAERRRQIEVEGYTAEHDAQHRPGEFTHAAGAYLYSALQQIDPLCGWTREMVEEIALDRGLLQWPWDAPGYRPKGPLSDLVRAGALIAAEIDRRKADDDE